MSFREAAGGSELTSGPARSLDFMAMFADAGANASVAVQVGALDLTSRAPEARRTAQPPARINGCHAPEQ